MTISQLLRLHIFVCSSSPNEQVYANLLSLRRSWNFASTSRKHSKSICRFFVHIYAQHRFHPTPTPTLTPMLCSLMCHRVKSRSRLTLLVRLEPTSTTSDPPQVEILSCIDTFTKYASSLYTCISAGSLWFLRVVGQARARPVFSKLQWALNAWPGDSCALCTDVWR